ncbi:histone H3.3-like [Contarinia nasturtii]|uniref:histone H3.3-like n=1 Tax=Contarinia nasturtii TaxID=265458 RepID=UPI0012D465C6|nr:histone H3.3-like [Contarinia nasturtii]
MMCAKVSKKSARAVEASPPDNRTPRRNVRQTPSRNRGKVLPQLSNRKSDHSNANGRSESDEESAEEDFLGRPPSHEPSESNQQSQDSDEIDDSSQQTSPRQTTRNTVHRPTSDRKSVRKQAKPKRKKRVIKEIVALQKSTKLLIARLPFQRLVREILQEFKNDFRLQSSTLECLQEAAETYLIQLFEDSYLCCLHRSRQTLTDKDIKLVQILRGALDPGRR